MKWLAGALGFSEPHMRELLRTKTPPGFVRSKGDRWIIKGPVTADRLAGLRRLYGVPEPPEMTIQTLAEFDASYGEFARWREGGEDAEKVAEAHPLFGPIYRKFKALEKELSIAPPEMVAARQAILDAEAVTPLDEKFWVPARTLVLASTQGPKVAREASKFPKKFLIIAALQHIRSLREPAPTFQELAYKLGVNRSTLFRWAKYSSLDLSLAISTIFESDATYGTASDMQEADLRIQKFARGSHDE